MADSKAHVSGGNKAESEATAPVGPLLSPRLYLRRESSASIKNFIRSFSRGEDVDSFQSKTLLTTLEGSSQQSGGAVARVSLSLSLEALKYNASRLRFLSSWKNRS
jgi:hypothetical protein